MNAEQAIELMDNWELEYGPKTRKAIAALIATQSRELELAKAKAVVEAADPRRLFEIASMLEGIYGDGVHQWPEIEAKPLLEELRGLCEKYATMTKAAYKAKEGQG